MILASQTLGTVFITIIAFLIVSLLLISVLLFVKQKLSPSGPVMITINGEKEIEVSSRAIRAIALINGGGDKKGQSQTD